MRIPHAVMIEKMARYIFFFVFGGLVGSFVILYMYGHLMNEIVLENRQLSLSYTNLQEDYTRIEQNMDELTKNRMKITIKKVNIEVVKGNEDKIHAYSLVEAEVIDRLRRDFKFLINLPIESVADTSEVVRKLIEGRRYDIQQQQIGVKVETLIIHSTVTVRVSMERIS